MLTTRELQDEIIRLKKEKDICILAHAYQSHDIWEVADYVGDSYGLSVQAAKAAQSTVLMCGVRFMAETVKILSPQKRVLLSNSNAGCPMAEQMDVELISGVKKMYPDYTVVAYINTTSELKTICDVCVTSSSAVQIVKNIENKNILFIPDCNLGKWVADQVPEKNIKLATYASRCIENEILMYLRRNNKTKMEVSIDEPLNVDWDGNELLLSDILGTDEDVIYRGIENEVERKLLMNAVSKLSNREKTIVQLRFGLGTPDGQEMTQKEVASFLGISQSYISRLEKKIMRQLKKEISLHI